MKYLRKWIKRIIGEPLSGEALVRSLGVPFGPGCRFVSVNRHTFGSEPYLVNLGSHVELAANVRFLTHDGGVWVLREEFPEADVFRPVTVGDNVFIGYGSIILPGTKIGNNVVIGAGSVVRGEIPSNCVAAGVPAKQIKSLTEYREKLVSEMVMTKQMSREQKKTFLMDDLFS